MLTMEQDPFPESEGRHGKRAELVWGMMGKSSVREKVDNLIEQGEARGLPRESLKIVVVAGALTTAASLFAYNRYRKQRRK